VSGSLVRSELKRLWSRRLTKLFLLAALGGIVFSGGALYLGHSKDLAAARAKARALYVEQIQFLEDNPDAFPPGVPKEEFLPRVGDFYVDPRFFLVQQASNVLTPTAVFLAVLTFVVAASYVGAEWHHGTIGQLLLWEPRRPRVLAAKAGVMAAGAGVAGFVGQCVVIGTLYLVAATRGTTEGADSAFVARLFEQAGRTSLLLGFTAVVAVVLATVSRSTAAALGIGFAYLAVLERFVAVLRPLWRAWLPGDNAATLLQGSTTVYAPAAVSVPGPGPVFAEPELGFHTYTAGRAAIILAVYALVLYAIALAVFRRRDVT
jgi:ABC-2 type transport system permease protein